MTLTSHIFLAISCKPSSSTCAVQIFCSSLNKNIDKLTVFFNAQFVRAAWPLWLQWARSFPPPPCPTMILLRCLLSWAEDNSIDAYKAPKHKAPWNPPPVCCHVVLMDPGFRHRDTLKTWNSACQNLNTVCHNFHGGQWTMQRSWIGRWPTVLLAVFGGADGHGKTIQPRWM